MSKVKKVTLTSIQQLIDLNEELTNFELSFTATSEGNKPFNMLVVDQQTLDNTPELNFKEVDGGVMSASIKSDSNVYQNYFLALKKNDPSDPDLNITVTIDSHEIPPKAPESNQKNDAHVHTGHHNAEPPSTTSSSFTLSSFFQDPVCVSIIVLIVVAILIGAFLYAKNKGYLDKILSKGTKPELVDASSSVPPPLLKQASAIDFDQFSKALS